jgi:hypothetical protein
MQSGLDTHPAWRAFDGNNQKLGESMFSLKSQHGGKMQEGRKWERTSGRRDACEKQ